MAHIHSSAAFPPKLFANFLLNHKNPIQTIFVEIYAHGAKKRMSEKMHLEEITCVVKCIRSTKTKTTAVRKKVFAKIEKKFLPSNL
jgi:hypothetical protein